MGLTGAFLRDPWRAKKYKGGGLRGFTPVFLKGISKSYLDTTRVSK